MSGTTWARLNYNRFFNFGAKYPFKSHQTNYKNISYVTLLSLNLADNFNQTAL